MRGDTLGAVVEEGGSGEAAEGKGRSNFVSGKDAAAKGIWQEWKDLGRVVGRGMDSGG